MDTKTTPSAFVEWMDTQLRERRLGDSEAASMAGLSHGAIYDIRAGLRPGIKKCRALARLFGFPDEYVLRLAGHLAPLRPTPGGAEIDPVRAELMRRLSEELSRLPPEQQRRKVQAFLVLLEAEEVADHAAHADILPEPTEGE